MANPLQDTRHYNDFDSHWIHITDPAQIKETLAAVNLPQTHNQLMVAKDPNNSYYAIYGNVPHKPHRGLFSHASDEPVEATPVPGPLEENPSYSKIYDRGDYPAAFLK